MSFCKFPMQITIFLRNQSNIGMEKPVIRSNLSEFALTIGKSAL